MFRKLLSAVTSTAVVAGLVTAGAVATAAPAAAEFPDPDPSTNAVISVKIGGDRTGTSGVDRTVTKEAKLQLYTNDSGAPGTAITEPWGTCETDGDGDCNFQVPIGSGTGQVPSETRLWVKYKSAPTGWFGIDKLRVGQIATPATPVDYQFRTPRLQSGEKYRSGTDFMTDIANDVNESSGGVWQIHVATPRSPRSAASRWRFCWTSQVQSVPASITRDGGQDLRHLP